MSKTILDTNIVSYLMKGGPLAEAYAPHVHHPQRSIHGNFLGCLTVAREPLNKWSPFMARQYRNEMNQ
jgi:hypothetical protein